MSNKQRLINDLSFFGSLRTVLGAYQEVALMKMQDSRDSVLGSRNYLQELGYVYFEVKYSYEKEMTKISNKKKQYLKEPRSVAVLLTPNEKLNGGMPYRVFYSFKDYVQSHPEVSVIVIGTVGEALYQSSGIDHEHQTFELLYGDTFEEDILNLIYVLRDFDEVLIFHGQFESLVSQRSVSTSLDGLTHGEEKLDTVQGNARAPINKTSFLFEPNIKDVVEFFDSQVKASLLRQSVHESRLAQFASRARAMDEALSNVEHTHKSLSLRAKRDKRLIHDKNQLNQLSSILYSV